MKIYHFVKLFGVQETANYRSVFPKIFILLRKPLRKTLRKAARKQGCFSTKGYTAENSGSFY